MFQIDVMSRKPVYEQLVDQIERYILMGVLKPQEKIPSVRSLSTELSVNPNTIQKSYTELDRRGIVYSVAGRGCFVSPDAKEKISERKMSELEELTEHIREFSLAGVPKESVIRCVQDAYGEPANYKKQKAGKETASGDASADNTEPASGNVSAEDGESAAGDASAENNSEGGTDNDNSKKPDEDIR